MKNTAEIAADEMRLLASSDLADKIQHSNEAVTRLLLVNKILGILGWSADEYNPEQATSTGGYTDYLLTIDGRPRLILEAKRTGHLSQQGKIQAHQYTNSYLYKSCGEEMRVLLDQCRRYCSDEGLPYAVATTGTVWIVLVGLNIAGVAWGKLRSFTFHSLQDIATRFDLFYNLISREAVRQNSLEEKFGSMIIVQPNIAIRPKEKIQDRVFPGRVPFRRELELFFDLFWSDLTRPERQMMLDHCYVDTREVTEFSKDLRVLLDYDEVLDEQGHAIDEATEENVEQAIKDQMETGDAKTILLVGRIGSGKSTFVYKFIRDQVKPRSSVCTVVDLINRATIKINEDRIEEQTLAGLILEKLSLQFGDKFNPVESGILRACFRKELEWFKMQRQEFSRRKPEEYILAEEEHLFNLSQDKYKHLVGYIEYIRNKEYIRGKRYKIWITLDNIDQGSDSYQAFVYAFAHKLTADAKCTTMITLREDTYLAAKESGFLNVRRTDIVFRLNAPELRQVIAKRRQYVDYLLKHEELERPLSRAKPLVALLNWHTKCVFLGTDDSIRRLITALSLNNVRYALGIIRSYYTSDYSLFHDFSIKLSTDNEDPLPSDNKVNLQLEYTQILQSLMLGASWNYDQVESEIFNLFDVPSDTQSSHFLSLRILAYLSRHSPRQTIVFEQLANDLIFLGHQRHQIEHEIRRLLLASLIISPTIPQGVSRNREELAVVQFPKGMRVVLSAKGYYYLNYLAGNHYYQGRVGEDTVWYDEEKAVAYIRALQESIIAQPEFGRLDNLMATNARSVFIQYLRKAMFEESQSGRLRSQNELARVINSIVEQRVFGAQITNAVYSKDEIDTGDSDDNSDIEDNRGYNAVKEAQKQRHNDAVQQLSFDTGRTDQDQVLREAVQSLGKMPSDKRFQQSRYVVRILWALELAFRSGMPPLRATSIATLITEYGNDKVFAPNVAKFFRNQRQYQEYTHLWKEEPPGRYSINQVGRDLLMSIMDADTTPQGVDSVD